MKHLNRAAGAENQQQENVGLTAACLSAERRCANNAGMWMKNTDGGTNQSKGGGAETDHSTDRPLRTSTRIPQSSRATRSRRHRVSTSASDSHRSGTRTGRSHGSADLTGAIDTSHPARAKAPINSSRFRIRFCLQFVGQFRQFPRCLDPGRVQLSRRFDHRQTLDVVGVFGGGVSLRMTVPPRAAAERQNGEDGPRIHHATISKCGPSMNARFPAFFRRATYAATARSSPS